MRVLHPDTDSGSFTRIPNALFAANLPASLERAWIRLASLDRGPFSVSYRSLEGIADELGYNRSALGRVMREMEKAGLLVKRNGDWVLVVPAKPLAEKVPPVLKKSEPKQEARKVEEPKEVSIAEEVAAEPRRTNRISEKDAKAVVIQTWNKYKPQPYVDERSSMNPAVWVAFETQAKRLKIEREDYEEFLKSICRGLKASDFWSTKSFKLTNVFGYSANIEDKKFQSVEALYKQGQTKEAKSAAFEGTTTDFIDWYNAKGFPVQSIDRRNVSDWNEALAIEEKILSDSDKIDRSVARVYYAEGKPVFWSGKMNQKSLYYLP